MKKTLFRQKMFLLRPSSREFFRKLLAAESSSPDFVEELNRRRRRELVRFAYENVDFYRQKYSEVGFELGDTESDDYFENLPILEKHEVRASARRMVPMKVKLSGLKESTTGGSTGEPLKTYHDPDIPLSVLSWRVLEWWGADACDNSGYLYRAVPRGTAKVAQSAALWPTRRAWIPASQMTPQELRCFLSKIIKIKAKYLVGYVGAIEAFADYLQSQGERVNGLKAIWTTASPLPEGKRRFLEQIFQCPVYTQYGSCEVHWLSAECSFKNGMHVFSDVRHVEIIEKDRTAKVGEYGDIVVTDLLNFKFPMIRYRIGDRGRLLDSVCPCGRPFPLMDYVKGRVSDSIATKENGIIPGEFWTTIFDDFTQHVKSFRVHQHLDYSIAVSYEFHSGVRSETAIETVRSRLREIVGPGVAVEMIETSLAGHENGKTRFVTSELVR